MRVKSAHWFSSDASEIDEQCLIVQILLCDA